MTYVFLQLSIYYCFNWLKNIIPPSWNDIILENQINIAISIMIKV